MDDSELERFYNRHGIVPECRSGWHPIIEDLDRKIAAIAPDYKAEQIKEKFGTLRFYFSELTVDPDDWDAVYTLVDEAEEQSRSTCEVCGSTDATVGPRTRNQWIKTLCESHAN